MVVSLQKEVLTIFVGSAGRVDSREIDPTQCVVEQFKSLMPLTRPAYAQALTAWSKDLTLTPVDTEKAVPLLHYLAGGLPRLLRFSTEPTNMAPVCALSAWHRCLEVALKSAQLHYPPHDFDAVDFAMCAMAAFTREPVKDVDARILGSTRGTTYAIATRAFATRDESTQELTVPPLVVAATLSANKDWGGEKLQRQLQHCPPGFDLGAMYVGEVFAGTTVGQGSADATKRGVPFERAVTHALLARYCWLMNEAASVPQQRSADAAAVPTSAVPLHRILRVHPSELPARLRQGATVDWSEGLVVCATPSSSSVTASPKQLVAYYDAASSPHDMRMYVDVRGATLTVAVQFRHGRPKEASELLSQGDGLPDALLVVSQIKHAVPRLEEFEKACRNTTQQATAHAEHVLRLAREENIGTVDASKFCRSDVVHCFAPFQYCP
jgi:hypothetical protein